MDNYEVAKVLDETADMLEVAGENFFRVHAYHNAARAIRDQTKQVGALSQQEIDEILGSALDSAGAVAECFALDGALHGAQRADVL